MKTITVGKATFANNRPFSLICGPCQIEGRDHALRTAERIKAICDDLGIAVVYKSSFDKANRTSIHSSRGVGMDAGLAILADVKQQFEMPVLTDIHDAHQAAAVGEVVDILQIPAFLCRQTDLVVAAAKTGRALNIKKGQFMAPWDMTNIAIKAKDAGNDNVMLCDRGTMFGYGNLITDFRGLRTMAGTGYPVVFDATHSVQMPSANGTTSGAKREFVEPLARAAAAIGVAGFFMEAHEDPGNAPCDGPNMIPLDKLKGVLTTLKTLDEIAKSTPYQDIQSD